MFEQNFPIRAINHIKETVSYKVFENNIPNHWLVRQLSERDYGIDALIELVNSKNQVTGIFTSFQLKSTANVNFDNSGKYRLYKVNKNTTNYWLNSNIPAFLLLIDETKKKIYFKSVADYVRQNYNRYSSDNNFYYEFYNSDEFNVEVFLNAYRWTENLNKMEEKFISLPNLYKSFSNFYYNNIRRDFHMLVEDDEVLFDFNFLLSSIFSICFILDIAWDIPTPKQFVQDNDIGSDAAYGDYFMYEYHMTELLIMLDKKLLEVLKVCQRVVCDLYSEYWQKKQPFLHSFLSDFVYETLEKQYWKK